MAGSRWIRRLRFLMAGLVLGGLLLSLLTLCEGWVERTFIFFPTGALLATPLQVGLEFQDCFFPTTDGLTLHGWYIPGPRDAPVLLWCHGNGGNLSYELENLALVHRAGLGVFIFDYRGYGLSQGRPSEAGVYADAAAAYAYLTGELKTPPARVALFGRSLGAAVAADLACRVPALALVLEAGFTNVGDMARQHYFWLPGRNLYAHKFDAAARLALVTMPKLIIHGDQDYIVPLWMGQKLYDLAPPPKEFCRIAGAGHNDILEVAGREYLARLTQFLGSLKSDQ
jgi:fermentation-respiration switch protein FrsA (DUF1100 family)